MRGPAASNQPLRMLPGYRSSNSSPGTGRMHKLQLAAGGCSASSLNLARALVLSLASQQRHQQAAASIESAGACPNDRAQLKSLC